MQVLTHTCSDQSCITSTSICSRVSMSLIGSVCVYGEPSMCVSMRPKGDFLYSLAHLNWLDYYILWCKYTHMCCNSEIRQHLRERRTENKLPRMHALHVHIHSGARASLCVYVCLHLRDVSRGRLYGVYLLHLTRFGLHYICAHICVRFFVKRSVIYQEPMSSCVFAQ